MENDILRFVEPVYRFCLKRLDSHTDAEDLAQEILLCVLQGLRTSRITNLDGYVWRIAHNRYASRIRRRKTDVTVLCGEEYLFDIPAGPDTPSEDDYPAVFKALHSLGNLYRDIVVTHYVHGRDIRTIAEQQDLSVETVKWRLHVGREKIRERMTQMERLYDKIHMYVLCNGSFAPDPYLNTQLYKAIAKACYEAPLTIEEISLSTGMPTLYLEEALVHMIAGDAIKKSGQKYATDFIITTDEQRREMHHFLQTSVVKGIADILLHYIGQTEQEMRAIGFYGSDFPLSRLLHILIPSILYATAERLREAYPLIPKQRPPRKDGGNGWFIVHEGIDHMDEGFAGCNQYQYDAKSGQSGTFLYYWTGNTFRSDLNKTLRDARFFINAIGPGNACLFTYEQDAAKAFASGLCENRSGRTYPAVPVFTSREYAAYSAWAKACVGLDGLWKKWMDSLFSAYKAYTPKRLADQIGGNVDGYSLHLSAFVLKELQNTGDADRAEEEPAFVKNLLLIRG